MNPNLPSYPGQAPIWPAGKEPLPPGYTEADRAAVLQTKRWEKYMAMGMESCAAKTVLAGGAGASLRFYFFILFLPLFADVHHNMGCRVWPWRVFLAHVGVVRVRGPVPPAANAGGDEYGAKGERGV